MSQQLNEIFMVLCKEQKRGSGKRDKKIENGIRNSIMAVSSRNSQSEVQEDGN